jgi:thiol-disulfide isomerase/thioredoxin
MGRLNYILIFMIVIIIGSGSVLLANDQEAAVADSEQQEETISKKTIAYYFYTTKRCPSCKKIEAYSTEAISTAFAEQLESGAIEFITINTDEKENTHYTEDYELYTKSLILSEIVNGKETKWANLEKIWELLGNKEKFSEYVVDGINDFMKAE